MKVSTFGRRVLLVSLTMSGCVGNLQDVTARPGEFPPALLTDDTEKDIAAADLDGDGDIDFVVARKEYLSLRDGTGGSNTEPGHGRTPVLLLNEGGQLRDRTELTPWAGLAMTSRDVVIANIDGDSIPDVVFANTANELPRVYLGVHDGTAWTGLRDATAELFPPTLTPNVAGEARGILFCAVAAGDVDGDGDRDLYFSNYVPSGTVPNDQTADVLLINRINEPGVGRFVDESAERLSDLRYSGFGTGVIIADMDDDGFDDIVKTSTLNAVPPWNANGTFILYSRPGSVDGVPTRVFFEGAVTSDDFVELAAPRAYMFELADFNRDGTLDVYEVDDDNDWLTFGRRDGDRVVHDATESIQLEREDLARLTSGFGGNVHAGDFNGDGRPDFIGVAPIDVQFAFTSCNPDSPGVSRMAMFANLTWSPEFFDSLEGEALLPAANETGGSVWELMVHDFAFADIDGNGRTDMLLGLCSGYRVLKNLDAE